MTRKFTIRLLFMLGIVLMINWALDRAFKEFSVHNIVNNTMDQQFDEFSGPFDYLAMGNSHNCISTHILENSFNYGSPSENYVQTYYKLKHILEKTGKKPVNLLLQADISSFGPKISSRYEYNSYWINYIDYFELARIKKSKDILTKWMEGRFFSYAGNYKDIQLSILYRIKVKQLEMYRGYRPHRDYRNFANEPDKQKLAWNKANLILSREMYLDPVMRIYFEKIIDLCNRNNIRVILVRIPMSKEFYTEEIRIVPAETLYAEVDELASRYPVYYGILDYHDLFFDHPEYFFDPDHLNIKGSDLFTEKLAGELQQLQLFFPPQ